MAVDTTNPNAKLQKKPFSSPQCSVGETSRLLHSSNVPSHNVESSINWTSPLNDSVGLAHTSSNSEVNGTAVLYGGTIVYRRRWYILLLFCLTNFTKTMIWSTWGPLVTSVEYAFDWSLGEVALLTNWGSVTYVVTVVIFCWLIDVKGGLIMKAYRILHLHLRLFTKEIIGKL